MGICFLKIAQTYMKFVLFHTRKYFEMEKLRSSRKVDGLKG